MSSATSLKSEFECSSQQGYDSIIILKIFQIYKYIGSNEAYDASEYKEFIDKYTKIVESSVNQPPQPSPRSNNQPRNWISDYFQDEDTLVEKQIKV